MKKLFEQTKINQMELKNRFVRSATWEGLADSDGSCNKKVSELCIELAKGQIGLIISSHAYINQRGKSGIGELGIDSDQLIDGYVEMVNKIHQEGSKIIMQITHGGNQSKVKLIKKRPLGPSPMKVKDNVIMSKAMTKEEISQTIKDFKHAALRAKKAGFDGVQIHAAHGYLLSSFLSPFFNHRTDEYGGNIENRARLVLEVYQAIRSELGKQFTILIKINADDFIEGGFTPIQMVQVAHMLQKAGIDAIEISGGTPDPQLSKYLNTRLHEKNTPEIYYRNAAKLYKEKIIVPLILVGGIRSYEIARELVEKELADYISMSRPLIREPDLIKRWQSGDTKKATCISCNQCIKPTVKGEGMYCVVEKEKQAIKKQKFI